MPMRPYEEKDNNIMDIDIQMNPDLTIIERKGYQISDFLSDLGGMEAFLYSIFSVVLSFLNYDHFNRHMASRLYKLKSDINVHDQNIRASKQLQKEHQAAKFIKTSEIGNFKAFFIDCMPGKLTCCKRSRYERGLMKAERQMSHEINIINIIKSRRFFKTAFQFLLTTQKRIELKRLSRYSCIDPDEELEQSANPKQSKKLFGSSKTGTYQEHNSTVTLTDDFDSMEDEKHDDVSILNYGTLPARDPSLQTT